MDKQIVSGREDDYRVQDIRDILDGMTCDRIADAFYDKFGIYLTECDMLANPEAEAYWIEEYNKTVDMFRLKK